MPVAWGDAFLYLSRARNLAERGRPLIENVCGPDYPPLYSLLLTPAYWLGDDPTQSYHLALVINAFLSSTLIFPCYLLHRQFFRSKLPAIAMASTATLLSASFGFSFMIMAENLMLPLTAALALIVFRYRDLRYSDAALAGFLTACCLLTKSVAVAFLPGLAFLTVWTCWVQRLRYRRACFSLLLALAGLGVPLAAWKTWSTLTLNKESVPYPGSYTLGRYFDYLERIQTDYSELPVFTSILLNQVGYLFFGTFLLGAVAVILLVRMALSTSNFSTGSKALLLMGAGLLVLSSWHSAVYSSFQDQSERYALFGRYMEALIPVLLILGSSLLLARKNDVQKALWGVGIIGLFFAIKLPAFSPGYHRASLFYLDPLTQLLTTRVALILLVLLGAYFLLSSLRRSARWMGWAVLLSLCMLSSLLFYISVFKGSKHLYYGRPIVNYLRQHFASRDLLLISSLEFASRQCMAPHHWMFMYQTETIPTLFSDLSEAHEVMADHPKVFLITAGIIRPKGESPVAKFQQLLLYRLDGDSRLEWNVED